MMMQWMEPPARICSSGSYFNDPGDKVSKYQAESLHSYTVSHLLPPLSEEDPITWANRSHSKHLLFPFLPEPVWAHPVILSFRPPSYMFPSPPWSSDSADRFHFTTHSLQNPAASRHWGEPCPLSASVSIFTGLFLGLLSLDLSETDNDSNPHSLNEYGQLSVQEDMWFW